MRISSTPHLHTRRQTAPHSRRDSTYCSLACAGPSCARCSTLAWLRAHPQHAGRRWCSSGARSGRLGLAVGRPHALQQCPPAWNRLVGALLCGGATMRDARPSPPARTCTCRAPPPTAAPPASRPSLAADLVIPNSRGVPSTLSRPEEEALAKQIALHEGWVAGKGTGAVGSGWQGSELQAAYERCVPQRRCEGALLLAVVTLRAHAGRGRAPPRRCLRASCWRPTPARLPPLRRPQVRRGDERVRQDILPGHAADDAGAGQGHLGHLRLVPVRCTVHCSGWAGLAGSMQHTHRAMGGRLTSCALPLLPVAGALTS